MNSDCLTVVEAPDRVAASKKPSVFLAGGITNCPVWQDKVVEGLHDLQVVVFNPRRTHWPEDDELLVEQIEWERDHINSACLRAFWFPSETECPVTLLELGYSLAANLPIVVGCHPEYSRKLDVQIQIRLSDSTIEVVDSLGELTQQIRDIIKRESNTGSCND